MPENVHEVRVTRIESSSGWNPAPPRSLEPTLAVPPARLTHRGITAAVIQRQAEELRRFVEAWQPDMREIRHREAAAALRDLAASIEAVVPPQGQDG